MVKKVKGCFYAYLQESYRDGGQVKTRTVEYLGAVEPAVAQQVKDSRSKTSTIDPKALEQAIRADALQALADAEPAEEPAQEPLTADTLTPPPQEPEAPQNSPPPRYVEHQGQTLDLQTGELKPKPELVITTGVESSTKPLRPFSQSLSYPADLTKHKLSLSALHAVHGKFGRRLEEMGINPSLMPDVSIQYGHPDKLIRKRDGSYVIQASRRPKKAHTIIKSKLWENYRQALSSAYLDAIEQAQPERYNELASILSGLKSESQTAALKVLSFTTNPLERFKLSLQVSLWKSLPAPTTKTKHPEDFGAIEFGRGDWRSETVQILANVQKSGWAGYDDLIANAERRHRAAITRKRNQIAKLSLLDRMSGKRRKLLREIREVQAKQRANRLLRARFEAVKAITDFSR